MDEEIRGIIAELTKRLERLENHDQQNQEAAVIESGNHAHKHAKFAALYSIVHELAAREGLSAEQFSKHFEERVRYYRDYYLRIAENIDPNWAGQIDERDLADMPEGESYPPLFE